MSSEKMHVWTLEHGEEYVVAVDATDALDVYAEHIGEGVEQLLGYSPHISRVDDDVELQRIHDDAVDVPVWCSDVDNSNGQHMVTATAREWADNEGRGHLFGRNW